MRAALVLLSNALVVASFRAGGTSPVRARQAVLLAAERPDPFAVPRPDPLGWACASLTLLSSACASQGRLRLHPRQATSLGGSANFFA